MMLSEGQHGKTYTAVGIELEQVSVLNLKSNGSMIIKVRGTRFAIGRKIAEGIKINED